MNTIRWNVAVSADTDQSLRMFLASQGGGRKGDLLWDANKDSSVQIKSHSLK